MRKLLSLLLSILCVFCLSFSISGCKSKKTQARVNIVCTIFAEYDWAKELTKGVDGVNITLLCDTGMDMHSYQPSVEDVVNISSCDVFIYVGGESDKWANDALKNVKNSRQKTLNLLEILGENARNEEFIEGMQGEPEEDPETDEHVWLSIKNAKIFCEKIKDTLCQIDSAYENKYTENFNSYKSKLDELDQKYTTAVNEGNRNLLVFADRFPFLYLVKDYNLDYYAIFVGCSTETNATFETMTKLANKIDNNQISVILKIENTTHNIAESIKQYTKSKNQTILVLNSMQSITKNNINNGANYIAIMEQNLNVLKQALQ